MFLFNRNILLFSLTFIYNILLCYGQDNNEDDCVCVPYFQCENGKVLTAGEGLLDVRIKTCSGVEVCCQLPGGDETGNGGNPSPVTPTNPPTKPPTTGDNTDNEGRQPSNRPSLPTVSSGKGCGRRRFPGEGNSIDNSLRITGLLSYPEETFYGEAPWMVRLLPRQNGQINDTYLYCGGALVTPSVVLTAAHCVSNITTDNLVVRVGDWNIKETYEPIEPENKRVTRFIIHPNFNARNLVNDIALIGLDSPVKLSETVDTVCTPEEQNPVNTSACIATGWGKNELGRRGTYQDTLRKVTLPIMDREECQTKLRKTKLGKYFTLLPGFLCAGGIQENDTCEGDGGGPLFCPLVSDPNRFAIVGVIAWGIDCGKGNPAVFADVKNYMPWIKTQIS